MCFSVALLLCAHYPSAKDQIKLLIEECHLPLNMTPSNQKFPFVPRISKTHFGNKSSLINRVIKQTDFEFLEYLLKNGADVSLNQSLLEAEDSNDDDDEFEGELPLVTCLSMGNLPLLNVLLENGASPTTIDTCSGKSM